MGAALKAAVTPLLLRSAAVAALGGFLFGFDTAVISGATDALRLRFALDSDQLGFTVASALIGTVFGFIGAGQPSDDTVGGRSFARLRSLPLDGFWVRSGVELALARDVPVPGRPRIGVHRVLRVLAGRGHLGLHQRDLPQPRARPRPGARQLHALVLGRGRQLEFPVIAEASGASAFAFFAVMMVLQFVLVWLFLPETKGVSLERIQRTLGIE